VCPQRKNHLLEQSERMKKSRQILLIASSISLVSVFLATASSPARAATTYRVGAGQGVASLGALPALVPGDTVEVMGDASYGSVTLSASGSAEAKITFRGVPVNGKRPVFNGGTNTVAFEGSNHVVFDGFEVTGGSSRCVFNHAADVLIRNTLVHDCPAHGILGADYDTGSLTLDHVEVHHSGAGDQKHPIYIATDEVAYPGSVFRMQNCYLHDNNGGHGVKSRAERNEIYFNWIEGSYYHELELIGPDGPPEELKREDSDVVGNVIRKTGPNQRFHAVRVGGDGTGQTHGRYRFVNNTFILGEGTGSALRAFDGVESIEAHNNVFFRPGGASIELVRTVEASGTPAVFGSHNWATGGSPIPTGWTGTVTGADPGFTAFDKLDLRPVAGSPLCNQGQMPPTAFAGHELPNPVGLAVGEPARDAVSSNPRRTGTDLVDIGAFEAVQ
jgi:hypothetical protein